MGGSKPESPKTQNPWEIQKPPPIYLPVVPIAEPGGPQVVDEQKVHPVIVSITTLGANAGGVTRAAGQVVNYLEGNQAAQHQLTSDSPSRAGSLAPDVTPITTGLSRPAGGYYADSAKAAGIWRGQGASVDGFDLGSSVDPQAFSRLLLGQDPNTAEQLIKATGSNGRSRGHSHNLSILPSDPSESLTAAEVADIVGVDVSYIRRLATKTAALRTAQASAAQAGETEPETPASYLDGTKNSKGAWSLSRIEAERFATARTEQQVVLGYDITFSVPKSVSALYAQGTVNDQTAIDQAIESAVSAGMDYLEREGFHARQQGGRVKATGMVAASYRHDTNRALEPQLHEHVVVANMATNTLGKVQAVEARGLFAHATTAGYLAAAELRRELANRLGIEWAEVHKGIADIEGVDRPTIMAISSRREAVLALSEEMGYFTASARQKAALATRPSKDHSVEATELNERWQQVLNEAGFDQAAVDNLRDRNGLRLWTPTDTDELFNHLASRRGVTEQAAIFDRRDVLQAVATYSNDRTTAAEIEDLADQWLGTEAVIPLEVNDGARRETIGFGTAQVSLTPDEQRYTTPHMLTIEQRVIELHQQRIDRGYGLVKPHTVERAITDSPISLGADQAAMIRAITTSGDQFQAVMGRAGAGKTTALQAAVHAWEAANYKVIGAVPFAEAARNLETETGLRSFTLEGLLTRIETAGAPRDIIDHTTIIIVDEASTIGNRQLDRLYRHTTETGATVRTIGDPHQHQSVEAGGLWKHLITIHSSNTPALEVNRRQTGTQMGQVRLALDEYRHGQINKAMRRLDDDSRIVTAPAWEELLDTMATDWFVDHQRHAAGLATNSKMIAERNSDRHALNQRTQTLLHRADLLGNPVTIGETRFHVGDRVVAQAADPELRAKDAARRDHVINGSQGTVTAIKGTRAQADLIVHFDGLGEIGVPNEFITTEVGPGRGGGLTPGYAVTSFKAEGQTYDTGRNLAAPGAVNTEGMYVALTRGRNDQRTYTIAPDDQRPEPPELPIIADERTALEALAESLSKSRGADLASLADPSAALLSEQVTRPLSRINGRALDLAETRIAATAINNPDQVTVAALGPRPPVGEHRHIWDEAVGQAATYRSRWETEIVTIEGSVTPASPGDGPERYDHYDRVQTAVLAADIEQLSQLPLAQLLHQRHEAHSSLPTSPNRDLQRSENAVATATEKLWTAREQLDAAQHEYEVSQPQRHRRRRDPNTTETARRQVDLANQTVAAAEINLERATQRLGASRGNNVGRAAVQARVASFDRSLDRRVTAAVKRPTSYITDTLGQRPKKHADGQRWDKAATNIEKYRHRHLGLTPNDGPFAGEGNARAIGARPTNLLLLRPWKKVQAQLEQHLAQPLVHERPLQRTR